MVDKLTPNKNYPLPHPTNIASKDVTRIATAITMIDADVAECARDIETIESTVHDLDAKSLRIPSELVGTVNTELHNIAPRQYIVINENATGFSTVEGGGGEGGKKGEILVKKSDANFDTTWIDPRSILKKAPTIKEITSDAQLPNNGTIILKDTADELIVDDLPQLGLTQMQINSDVIADSSCSYILCNEIDNTSEDESDIATREKFGRVKIGAGINLDNGTISVDEVGVASKNDFGIVKIGDGLEIEDGVLSAKTYKHADHENFGIIKPGSDFNFDSNGALQLAKKSEDIIYQTATKNIIENGIIKLVSTCAHYRAFINEDTLFSFDLSDLSLKNDISFYVEIISDGDYVVNFGNNVTWDLPCNGVPTGTTIIKFSKLLGVHQIQGTLISTDSPGIKNLIPETTEDISNDYIVRHNGCNVQAKYIFAYKDVGAIRFTKTDSISSVDFARSTCVKNIIFHLWRGTITYMYVEGSVDGSNWKRLLSVNEECTTGTHSFDLTTCGFFRHYRILTGPNTSADFLGIKLSGFDVEDELYELHKLVPSMDSNSEYGYTITSSGLTNGSLYYLTQDNTNGANFETRLNGEFWVKYELPEAQSVDLIDLSALLGNESDRMSTWFRIDASNDDENWVTILERKSDTRWYHGESRQYWIYNNNAYKYYKFISIEQPTVSLFALSRFRLYKKINGIVDRRFIPTLQSANHLGYEITASSTYGSNHYPYQAFDGEQSTSWATASGDTVGAWLQVKFPTKTLCSRVYLTARNDSYYGQSPSSFKILGSLDGENFDLLKTVNDQTWAKGESKYFDFFNETPYLYYRIEVISTQDSSSNAALLILNFGSAVREYKKYLNNDRILTPIMTSNSQDGFIVTANSTYSGQKVYNPFEAFNRQVSDYSSWTTKTQSGWIQVELPEADKINKFSMSSGYSNEEPDSFILYGSNDGQNYDELLNSGKLTWIHNETKTWVLDNDTAYKFYKIEAVNTKSAFITISEIQLIEHTITKEY